MTVNMTMTYIAQAVLFLLSLVLYSFLVGKLLPRVFIRPDYHGTVPQDRGLKKYTYENGRAIVFEPELHSKKFIDQYIVSLNNGEKFLKCRADKQVFSIKYDVIVFDLRDRVIDVISVDDTVKADKDGLLKAVSLPSDTSYVSLIVKAVNGVRVNKKPTSYYSGVKLAVYVALCALLTALEVMIIKAPIFDLLDRFIHYTERVGNNGDVAAIVIAAAVSVICSLLVILAHRTSAIGIKNDSKIFALVKKIIKKMRGVRHGKKSTANFKRFLSIFTAK